MRTLDRSPYIQLLAAASAALTASLGDFLMLYVALGNAPIGSPSGRILLGLGGLFGVVAIPAYFVGYRACRLVFISPPAHRAKGYLTLAALVGVFGALTHGLTAIDIYHALSLGASTRQPDEAFASFVPLAVTGSVAALACLGAVLVLMLAAVLAGGQHLRLLAGFNPIVGTAVLSMAALLIGDAGSYLSPAAPNIAHAIFFAACTVHLHRIASAVGDDAPPVD